MKKVDYEHFSRFLMPHSPAARGEELYFCVKRADMEENRYFSDLWLWKGGAAKRLTSSGDVNGFWLTEAGVVFSALRGKRDKERAEAGEPLTVLQLLPYDGGEARELCRLDCAVTALRFAGEGRFFFTADCSRDWDAALAQAQGDAKAAAEALKRSRAECRVIDELPFWFNGRGFVNGCRSRLGVYENGAHRFLTGENTDVSLGGLSPDGKKLSFTASDWTGSAPIEDRLCLLDTDTLEIEDVTVREGAQHYWSLPLGGGRLAALVNTMDKYGINENPKLFLREGGAWRLVLGDGAHCFGSSVGSDVKADSGFCGDARERAGELFFLDTQGGETQLLAVDEESGKARALAGHGLNISSACLWREGFAACAMRGASGVELMYIGPDGSENVLTEFNSGICEEYEYSAPEALNFVNSQGREIAGWVIRPAGFEPGKKYPAILDIHGGPKTVYGSCYFHEMQLWASRGFAVLFCNPTGGDGGGDEFADIRGQYGRQDFADLMQFVDTALKRCDFIDAERLGVTGGSYGGFMTNWVIGHTDRFRCAASQRSISNWVSFRNSADIGWYFAEDQVGGEPWTGLEKIWGQSPLAFADRVTTPTLFIHSEEDYRCPLSEGIQMFYALRQRGVESRMCIFKGENHELSRSGRPQNRVRRLREITEWMERHLK